MSLYLFFPDFPNFAHGTPWLQQLRTSHPSVSAARRKLERALSNLGNKKHPFEYHEACTLVVQFCPRYPVVATIDPSFVCELCRHATTARR